MIKNTLPCGSIKESLVKILRISIYRFGLDDVLLPSICSQYYAYNLQPLVLIITKIQCGCTFHYDQVPLLRLVYSF